ncbi:MAG: hypothetical protein PHW18_03125 [Sulfuricurvum sp.]|uniref:hypothetical protein n=1 Tax=Sulfuricurvum sp. TaxID=2025608 RepID=UPI0026367302|nr:hypothetical protein [Sulfuricurvum sp.]MDD2828551.1 hypothetical protein [Sulfuricurvum sp.]MDD4948918.1 hypothetical protein [Sulfuricurvum sp.]
MLSSFLSRILPSKSPKALPTLEEPKRIKNINPIEILNHSVLDANGVFLNNFNLFHHEQTHTIDLLLFFPHYGLFFGEKIGWKSDELKGASVERSSRQSKKTPATKLESTEYALHQKLEDVLSFDSTPIERFFLLEYLSEVEFDALDSSFHRLLPKERLIFCDDDIQSIQEKLLSLGTYHDNPYSKLKVLGSLNAHTLLLPTHSEPFGVFLSEEQHALLNAPLNQAKIVLKGAEGSGKSTILVRKVLKSLLEDPKSKVMIVTPTLVSGELFRRELIALCDFAMVHIDFGRVTFINPPTPTEAIDFKELLHDISLIILDDYNFYFFINTINLDKQSIIISSKSEIKDIYTYPLSDVYRIPSVNFVYYVQQGGPLFALLSKLREQFEQKANTPILIVLSDEAQLQQYKNAIDEYLKIECRILNSSFSLQYKNLDPITLSTTEYIVGLSVPHTYIINIASDTDAYSLALSRASETATIITEEIQSF